MKLSTKNLLIVFAALIVVFAIIQFTKRDNRSRDLRTELVNIDTAKVTQVKITSSKGEVVLEKEGNWVVGVGDTKKKTRDQAVAGLLNNLNTIKPSRLAAKSKESWEEYQLTDSAATRVQVYDGSNVLSDIMIGKFGVAGQRNFYTYVRLTDDVNSYVADGFMGMNVNSDASSYRDNEVLRLKKDSLTSVTFDYPDSAFVLTKAENWMINNQPADSASVASYLQGLSYLNSTRFYDEPIIGTRTHQVKFSFSDSPDVLVDAYFDESGFLLKTTENQESFQDKSVSDKILKSQKDFFPTDL